MNEICGAKSFAQLIFEKKDYLEKLTKARM